MTAEKMVTIWPLTEEPTDGNDPRWTNTPTGGSLIRELNGRGL